MLSVGNTYFPSRTHLIDLLKQTNQPQAKAQSKAKVLAEKLSYDKCNQYFEVKVSAMMPGMKDGGIPINL